MQESSEVKQDQHGLIFGAVILAAGNSQRMGRPKMLLPWGGTSVLGHLICQWQALGAEQVAVVIASSAIHLQQELQRLRFSRTNWIQNPSPERGMFSSVQSAANWTEWSQTLTHWALLLGDQPHLRSE